MLSLFTGAGGLDLGLEAAGCSTLLCVENDSDAQATLAANRPNWKIAQPDDAIAFASDPLGALSTAGYSACDIDILAGGPPCQPFSKAGYWTSEQPRRMEDPRAATIRAYLDIVAAIKPRVLLFENVPAFAYRGRDEGLQDFRQGIQLINQAHATNYQPVAFLVNAADYGVPQVRERIFVVAEREGKVFRMPAPTHGPASKSKRPYITAWDAIGEFDSAALTDEELHPKGKWADLLPSIPEGQNYLWHTPEGDGEPLFGWRTRFWSFLLKLAKNKPAWTIPASPGPATGPFHWRNRLLSSNELARLQTFPRDYCVVGSRRACQRQIGNAVPSALAELIGREIRRQFFGEVLLPERLSLQIRRRSDCPRAFPRAPVPGKYIKLKGNHKPHPGAGKGPGAIRSVDPRYVSAARHN